MSWFAVSNIDTIDTPALLVYAERVKENIRLLTTMVKDITQLRPHVKTNKMAEVCSMMMDAGITKFKCATIAEAEMLAMINAPDILLAYQPIGPKVQRLIHLVKNYPNSHFSCLVDNETSARFIAGQFAANGLQISLFIDLDVGMRRTGIQIRDAFQLAQSIQQLPNIQLEGLHLYDGHITDTDLQVRQQKADAAFSAVLLLLQKINSELGASLKIVAGGSPSFPTHLLRQNVECSPGTFVFWDYGYKHSFPDEPFDYAALVVTRVISIIDEHTLCLDLGHKSVGAENPLPRVHFLNAPELVPFSQSEEHMVVKSGHPNAFKHGDVLYGVPVHICPTVALYERAWVVENGNVTDEWKVVARNRYINI
ncbi:MAG: D-TA family PLP-dependent enzyme [Ferruginibacter sp.]